MSYIDLCSRVFSHIQSKDIREYYINEIRDSFNPNQIMFLIMNGFYSLEEKFKDIKELSEYTSYSNDLESLSANFIELSDIEKDYYDNDNVLYSGSFHEALYNYDDTLSYNDQRLYGRTFDEMISNLSSFIKDPHCYYDIESFSLIVIDKIHLNSCNKDFVRYYAYLINDSYVITDASVIENGIYRSSKYESNSLLPHPTAYRYPFKTGDRLIYKTPLMVDACQGSFYSEIDGNGTYYAFLELDEGATLGLSDMTSICKGYQSIDWLTKINEGENK